MAFWGMGGLSQMLVEANVFNLLSCLTLALSFSFLSITSEFSSFAANFVTVSFKFYKAFRDEKDVMNPQSALSPCGEVLE